MPFIENTPIIDPSETGEALKELNNDSLEIKDFSEPKRMSALDFKTRLHPVEIDGILRFDALVSFGLLPPEALIYSQVKKRLAVSESGKGRAEMVEIVKGGVQKEIETGKSLMSRLSPRS